MIKYSSIIYAFKDDDEINNYCDPDYKEKTIKELVFSIYIKILEYIRYGNCEFYDLIVEKKIIGYAFSHKNMLISFGVNKKHRNKKELEIVFNIIKAKFNTDFETYMWKRNERAINWLKKCGMEEADCNIKEVIKLKYKLCQ